MKFPESLPYVFEVRTASRVLSRDSPLKDRATQTRVPARDDACSDLHARLAASLAHKLATAQEHFLPSQGLQESIDVRRLHCRKSADGAVPTSDLPKTTKRVVAQSTLRRQGRNKANPRAPWATAAMEHSHLDGLLRGLGGPLLHSSTLHGFHDILHAGISTPSSSLKSIVTMPSLISGACTATFCSTSRSHCSRNASSTARKDKASFRPLGAMQRAMQVRFGWWLGISPWEPTNVSSALSDAKERKNCNNCSSDNKVFDSPTLTIPWNDCYPVESMTSRGFRGTLAIPVDSMTSRGRQKSPGSQSATQLLMRSLARCWSRRLLQRSLGLILLRVLPPGHF